jgi:hypothetical protein
LDGIDEVGTEADELITRLMVEAASLEFIFLLTATIGGGLGRLSFLKNPSNQLMSKQCLKAKKLNDASFDIRLVGGWNRSRDTTLLSASRCWSV